MIIIAVISILLSVIIAIFISVLLLVWRKSSTQKLTRPFKDSETSCPKMDDPTPARNIGHVETEDWYTFRSKDYPKTEHFPTGFKSDEGKAPQYFPEYPSTEKKANGVRTKEIHDEAYYTSNRRKTFRNFTMEKNTAKSSVNVLNKTVFTNDIDKFEEINDGEISSGALDTHYEKLNKSDENPQYAEIFPPNMQDILNELPDSAENILTFSKQKWKLEVRQMVVILMTIISTIHLGI